MFWAIFDWKMLTLLGSQMPELNLQLSLDIHIKFLFAAKLYSQIIVASRWYWCEGALSLNGLTH